MTTQERIEQQLVDATTIELLEEVDRRLTDVVFNPHREITVIQGALNDQVEFHFFATLRYVRDAAMNYNRARSLQNDTQHTHDPDKGVPND